MIAWSAPPRPLGEPIRPRPQPPHEPHWRALVVLAAGCLLSAVLIVLPTWPNETAPQPPTAAPAPEPPQRCAWFSATSATGEQVIVAATGPACGDPPVIEWIASLTHRQWTSTAYVAGTLIAQLGNAGATVRIWQQGWSALTEAVAGQLADDLAANGWTVQPPDPQGVPDLEPSAIPGQDGP